MCDIEIDQDEKESTPLPDRASEVCHIDDDNDESSTSSVRGKSPISIAISSRSNTRSPEIDIPPWDGSEICFGPSTYPVLPSSVLGHTRCTLLAATKARATSDPLS